MDPIVTKENVQDMQNEWNQVITDCLGTPVILREIFQNFSTCELIQFSLVNKLWSYEARSLLRDRGCLTGRLKSSDVSRPDLSAFCSDLRRINVIPFSGITLDVGLDNDELHSEQPCKKSAKFEPVYQEILERLPWRHLSLRFYESWGKCCPEFLLAKKLVETLSDILEEFSIGLDYRNVGFIHTFLQHLHFSRLKTLRFRSSLPTLATTDNYTNLIKSLVSRAPNLQVLHTTDMKVNLRGNLLEGSSAVHVTDYGYNPYGDIPESVIGELRMKEFVLVSFIDDFSVERFHRVVPMVLQTSLATLSYVYVDDLYLAPLMLYGICLENVKKLRIMFHLTPFNHQELLPGVWRIAKAFDFNRTFPKVNTVDICWRTPCNDRRMSQEFNGVLDQAHAALLEPRPDRAANIKTISMSELTNSSGGVSFRRFLSEMFPDVETLSVYASDISSGGIWDSWLDLKEINVTLSQRSYSRNIDFDSALCGISLEEARELREQRVRYLESVNIVPVMPSITCFKDLRTLRFFIGYSYYDNIKELRHDPTMLFSKVTCLTAFKRCPGLSVTLETKDKRLARALSHLKPYATVVLRNPGIQIADDSDDE